jgi:type 1 glutamine amidotransferase
MTGPPRVAALLVAALGCGGGGARPAVDASPAPDAAPDAAPDTVAIDVVLFSATAGFRHGDAISAGVTALGGLAAARSWRVVHTEDPAFFSPGSLDGVEVLAFLYTSGDVLDEAAQAVVQAHVARGGGFAGVHSASDTEYGWPWYGELVGAYFAAHPPGLPRGTIRVVDAAHPATAHLPSSWTRDEEWYAFRTNPADLADAHVLLALDEDSLALDEAYRMGVHPLAWYRHVHGGRAFYTALGHAGAAWSEPGLAEHVAGGIDWAAGRPSAWAVVDDFNGTTEPGTWDAEPAFAFDATRGALRVPGAAVNHHLTRRGVQLGASDRHAIDALFTIAAAPDDLNSFALSVAVQGRSAWSINLDLAPGGAGVMKHMGFEGGVFRQIGERRTSCCALGKEYRLRVEVNAPEPGWLTATLAEGRIVHERLEVDYRAFPYQPDPARPVGVGLNTHGADVVVRDLRVRRSPED